MSRNGDWCLAITAKFKILQLQLRSMLGEYCGQLTHNYSVNFIKNPIVFTNFFNVIIMITQSKSVMETLHELNLI